MKRNKNLETLSWEHHDGLVVAFRVEKGINNQTNPKVMVEYLSHIWDHTLQHHFWQEEAALMPHLQQIEEGNKLISKMINDHIMLKSLLTNLQHSETNQEATLKDFSYLLSEHIRFEERILFPLAEKMMPAEKLAQIGKFLHQQHRPGNKDWTLAFWKQGT
jgi:iron-sulfur cluster repair protein YtfE (RIC family)